MNALHEEYVLIKRVASARELSNPVDAGCLRPFPLGATRCSPSLHLTQCIVVFALLLTTAFANSLLPTLVGCSSGGPSTTSLIATFGEYVWNCSSSSSAAGGDGGVLWIMVPPPAANSSGLLSVEVRLGTFGQIIVDLGNVVRPLQDVNVTIVLCGATAPNGSSAPLLNFSDRPTTPVVMIVNGSNNGSSSSTVGVGSGGVRVAVVLASGVALWMRNVSSLLTVAAFPGDAGWAEVALEVRSGCHVKLLNVKYLVGVSIPIPVFVTMLIVLSNASLSTAVVNPSPNSVPLALFVHFPNITLVGHPSSGSFILHVIRCSVDIAIDGELLHFQSPSRTAPLIGHFLNISVAVQDSIITSALSLTAIVSDGGLWCAAITITVEHSILNFSAGSVLALQSANDCSLQSIIVILSRVNATFSGAVGAQLFAHTTGNLTASNVTTAVASSNFTFANQGMMCFLRAVGGSILAAGINALLTTSNFAVKGDVGTLILMTDSIVIAASDITVVLTESTVQFSSQGYLLEAQASHEVDMHRWRIAIVSSNFHAKGDLGSLFFAIAANATVSNAVIEVEGNSSLAFNMQGHVICGQSATYSEYKNITVDVSSSQLVFGGIIGSLASLSVFEGLFTTATNLTFRLRSNTSVSFVGEGYLLYVPSVIVIGASICITVSGSHMHVDGTYGAFVLLDAARGVTTLAGIDIAMVDLSTATFVGEGHLAVAHSQNETKCDDVAVVVRSSFINFRGSIGTFLRLVSVAESATLTAATLRLFDSIVVASRDCYLIIAETAGFIVAQNTTVFVETSSYSALGSLAAFILLVSISDRANATNLRLFVSGSTASFREGHLAYAYSYAHSSCESMTFVVESSTFTSRASFASFFRLVSRLGGGELVLLTMNVTNTTVDFAGGCLVSLATARTVLFDGIATEVRSSNMSFIIDSAIFFFSASVVSSSSNSSSLNIVASTVTLGSQSYLVDLDTNVNSPLETALQLLTVSLLQAVILCNGVVLVKNTSNIRLQLHIADTLYISRDSNLVALVVGLPAASIVASNTYFALPPSNPKFQIALNGPSMNFSLHSTCGLIAWYSNATLPIESMKWTVCFRTNKLGLPFRFRALRKLDVVGADRVAVAAERCVWGRGSHEFRATDSASASTSSSASHSFGNLTATASLITSLSLQQLAVVRHPLIMRGIGSSVLFVSAASSVVSSSVSTVVPGIQAIGQRSALQRQCNAYSAADGGSGSNTVVPPLSDAASNPFGVTIGALGDELMYAGGSVVSSLLLALIYATVVLVVAPLLRGPREWLRRMKMEPMAALRLPGSLYGPLALVLQPLTVAAVVLLASSSRSVGSVVFGLLLFVATAAPLCGLLWRVWDGRRQQLLLWRPASKATHHDQSSLAVVVRALIGAFGDRHECVPRSSHESASQRHFERYGVVVSSYAAGREWFVGVEVAAAVVSGSLNGVASGLDPSVVCSASVMDGFNWALAALCIVLLVAVFTLWPYSSRFGNLLSGLSSLLAAVCLALQSLSPDSPAILALTWAQSALGFLPLLFFAMMLSIESSEVMQKYWQSSSSRMAFPPLSFSPHCSAVRLRSPIRSSSSNQAVAFARARSDRSSKQNISFAESNLRVLIQWICVQRPFVNAVDPTT